MVATSRISVLYHMRKEDVEKHMHETEEKREYEHLLAIKLAYDGKTQKEIASILSRSLQTVYNWLNDWNENGLYGIMPNFGGGKPPHLNQKEFDELYKIIIKQKPCELMESDDVFWDIELVRKYVLIKYNVDYTYSAMWKIVREKFELNYIKPFSKDYRQPDNADEILKKRIEEVSEIVNQDKTVVGLIDETSTQNKPNVKRVLTEKSHVTCETSYHPSHRFTCTGFLETNGDLTFQNALKSKKEDFVIFLMNLRAKYEPDITIVAISDNAKIHKAQVVKEYCSTNKIVLVYLPPYSPRLNPIEDLWRLLKEELANRVLKTIEYLFESTEKILKSFGNLESLCSNWIKVFLA